MTHDTSYVTLVTPKKNMQNERKLHSNYMEHMDELYLRLKISIFVYMYITYKTFHRFKHFIDSSKQSIITLIMKCLLSSKKKEEPVNE